MATNPRGRPRLKNSDKGQKAKSKYGPRFQLVKLPAIEEFQLDSILLHYPDEVSAVTDALVFLQKSHQKDLRAEIRLALSTEQKLQYKNIHEVRQLTELRRQLQQNQKKLAAAAALVKDIDKAMAQSSELALQLTRTLDRVAQLTSQDGKYYVDSGKYPKLAKLLAARTRGPDEDQKDDAEGQNDFIFKHTDTGNGALNHTQDNETNPTAQEQLPTQGSQRSVFGQAEETPFSTAQDGQKTAQNPEVSSRICETPPHTQSTPSQDSASSQLFPKAVTIFTKNPEEYEVDGDLDADAFAQLIDGNIAKYRQKIHTRHVISKSPLRLLPGLGRPTAGSLAHYRAANFAGSLLQPNSNLHGHFFPVKSGATVGESAQLTIHKKLRINARPSKRSSSHCECRNSEIRASTVQKVLASMTDDEADGSSTDSSLDSSLDSELDTALLEEVMSESSPGPRHTPLHRTLQPKQLILKLQKAKHRSYSTSLSESLPSLLHQYTASPRASTTNVIAAMGLILHGGRMASSREHDIQETGIDTDSEGSVHDDPDTESLQRLKNLLIH